MGKSPLWFGYLDAGSKSSPVVLDARLDTGDPQTVYLFNESKGTILEYRREIVEPKLRQLDDGEAEVKSLRSRFQSARRNFKPRGGTIDIPEHAPQNKGKAAGSDSLPTVSGDDDIDIDDIDLDIDEDVGADDDWDDDED